MTTTVAIVTDEPGWHGRRLREAFAARGIVSRYTSLNQAAVRIERDVSVHLPGFENGLPDAVFVRGIPGGSLEQVVHYLNVLHVLRDLGVPVYNDGRAIERSVDKSLTSVRLRQAGIRTPSTWVFSDSAQAEDLVRHETAAGNTLLCKPLFGSQGQGIRFVDGVMDLPPADAVNNVWYLQQSVGSQSDMATDWRVFVIGDTAVAAMRRTALGRLANVAQGAQCHAALPEGELGRLAENAVACLDMAYAGVDLMRDDEGRWQVIEVNSIPAWKGLQSVSQVDVAGCLADDLMKRCIAQPLGEVVS